MDGKPSVVNVICFVAQKVEELGIHDCHDEFEGVDIAFVYAVCAMYDISDEDFSKALMTYHPLPHRLQYIGEACGIRFYDDSISTICDTTIQALKSLPDTDAVLIGVQSERPLSKT